MATLDPCGDDPVVADLARLRTKLALLEAQAQARGALDASRQLLQAARPPARRPASAAAAAATLLLHTPAPQPARRPASALLSSSPIADLRRHLQAVVDADAAGCGGARGPLAAITQRHCIDCALGIVRAAEDAAAAAADCFSPAFATGAGAMPPAPSKAAVELAASALCSLSQRPSAHELLLDAGAVPSLVALLSPAMSAPRAALASAAAAIGNLSADAPARRAVRAARSKSVV